VVVTGIQQEEISCPLAQAILAVALSMAVNVGQGAPALADMIAEFQKNEKTLHLITRQSLPENAPDMRLVVVVALRMWT
jgi:hypothetical protein